MAEKNESFLKDMSIENTYCNWDICTNKKLRDIIKNTLRGNKNGIEKRHRRKQSFGQDPRALPVGGLFTAL